MNIAIVFDLTLEGCLCFGERRELKKVEKKPPDASQKKSC